jgi:hypothetical protein
MNTLARRSPSIVYAAWAVTILLIATLCVHAPIKAQETETPTPTITITPTATVTATATLTPTPNPIAYGDVGGQTVIYELKINAVDTAILIILMLSLSIQMITLWDGLRKRS